MLEALVLCAALGAGCATDGAAVARGLEAAAAGLLVRSETDAPLAAVVLGPAPEGEISDRFVLERSGLPPDAPVRVRTVEAFFRSQSSPRPWHSPAEARRARRFRRLTSLLLRDLRDTRVFEVGVREKQVFVLGLTASGECVGLRTFVVET
jgi:hypothetical protein